jgi:hypothetical protein
MPDLIETIMPEGQAVQALWHRCHQTGQLPKRADFSIEDLRPWLGRLILVDVLYDSDGLDLFYRVHGTTLAEMLGQELTGKRLSDLQPPELRALIRGEYVKVVAARVPMVVRRRRSYGDRGTYLIERTLLPLSRDGTDVDQVLSLACVISGSHTPNFDLSEFLEGRGRK